MRVIIIGDHPHTGRVGRLVEGTEKNMLKGIRVNGKFMALVEFEDGGSCYALSDNIRLLC